MCYKACLPITTWPGKRQCARMQLSVCFPSSHFLRIPISCPSHKVGLPWKPAAMRRKVINKFWKISLSTGFRSLNCNENYHFPTERELKAGFMSPPRNQGKSWASILCGPARANQGLARASALTSRGEVCLRTAEMTAKRPRDECCVTRPRPSIWNFQSLRLATGEDVRKAFDWVRRGGR